jgi:hypothetical protein
MHVVPEADYNQRESQGYGRNNDNTVGHATKRETEVCRDFTRQPTAIKTSRNINDTSRSWEMKSMVKNVQTVFDIALFFKSKWFEMILICWALSPRFDPHYP